MNGLTRLRAPMAEDIFLLISSICFAHERCSSINRPSDLASLTFLIDFPSISKLGRKYARIFVRGHYLFLVAHSFRFSEQNISQLFSHVMGLDHSRARESICWSPQFSTVSKAERSLVQTTFNMAAKSGQVVFRAGEVRNNSFYNIF